MRPEVLAAVYTKISSLRYNTTLYDKNLSFFRKSVYLCQITLCHITKTGNFIKSAQMSLHDTSMAHTDVLRSIFQSLYPAFKERPIKMTNINMPLISKSGTSTAQCEMLSVHTSDRSNSEKINVTVFNKIITMVAKIRKIIYPLTFKF